MLLTSGAASAAPPVSRDAELACGRLQNAKQRGYRVEWRKEHFCARCGARDTRSTRAPKMPPPQTARNARAACGATNKDGAGPRVAQPGP